MEQILKHFIDVLNFIATVITIWSFFTNGKGKRKKRRKSNKRPMPPKGK